MYKDNKWLKMPNDCKAKTTADFDMFCFSRHSVNVHSNVLNICILVGGT